MQPETGVVKQGDLKIGRAVAHVTGNGTVAPNPVFVPDAGGIASELGVIPPGGQGLVNELGGLIGGKKKKKKKQYR